MESPLSMGKKKKTTNKNKLSKEDVNGVVHGSSCFLCAAPAVHTCQDCHLVQYCKEDHRRLHRPESFCFPFKIDQNPEVGRFMVATRDIQPLELILYDFTLARGPKMGTSWVCLQCLRSWDKASGYRCSRCKWPMCSLKCEEGRTHQTECEILAKAVGKIDSYDQYDEPSLDYYRCIAPLRLLLLRDCEPEFYERFGFLMDHNEGRKKDKELWNIYQKHVNEFLRDKCELADRFSNDEIDRACGIFWTNAFASTAIGSGQAVFPTFSFCSHSCISNSNHVVMPNRHLALQAKRLIREGEELTISYISPLQSTLRRQTKLRDKWFFTCQCQRCCDPTECGTHLSSLLCQAQSVDGDVTCDGILTCQNPVSDESGGEKIWKCSNCSALMECSKVLDTENKIAKELQEVEDQRDVHQFQALFKKYTPILHRNHYLLVLLKRHIISLASQNLSRLSLEELRELKAFCQEVLEVLDVIEPGYNLDRGSVLRHLSESRKLICRKLFAEEQLSPEQFSQQVQECMDLFEESQKCTSMLVKK